MLNFRIEKHCDDLFLRLRVGFLSLKYELSASELTREKSRPSWSAGNFQRSASACSDKMASASTTPSSRNLQLVEAVMPTLPLLAGDLRFFASSHALPLWYINLPLFTSTITIEYLLKNKTVLV